MAVPDHYNTLPTVYTDNSGHIIPHFDDIHFDSELPTYTQSQQAVPPPPVFRHETKEFRYAVNTHAFLEMTLITDGSYSKNLPTFVQGSPVQGRIHLKLDRPDSFSKVVLTVTGLFITNGSLRYQHYKDGYKVAFLDEEHTIWSHNGNAKLNGEYTWPFSVDLPEQIEIAGTIDHQPKKFPLPHTFVQRNGVSTIKYEISVKLVRNSIFKLDETLSANFAYIPIIRPPPLPPLRRLAYEEGTPLLGPDVDPEGWYLVQPVTIEGTLLNHHVARAECKLFLANPLSYSRGSVIPLFLAFESDDQQLLDLLSSPKAITARVKREIKWSPEAHAVGHLKDWQGQAEYSQRAVWRPAKENSGEHPPERVRTFNGELSLKPGMEPTSEIATFRMDYSIALFPFDIPGFIPSGSPSDVLLEEPITIVTAFAPGPRPRMSTPAEYKPDLNSTNQSNVLQPIKFY